MKRSIPELARRLKSNSGDEAALYAVFKTVRDSGLVEELVVMLDLWMEVERGESVPDRALADLYFCIAKRSSEVKARELCRVALDLWPAHAEALSLFEHLVDESWADELCARYQNFLEHAPSHAAAPRIRLAMIEMGVVAHYRSSRGDDVILPSDEAVCEAEADFEHAFVTALMPNPLLDSQEKYLGEDTDDHGRGEEPAPRAMLTLHP